MNYEWSPTSAVGKYLTQKLKCPHCGAIPTTVVASLQVYGVQHDEASGGWRPAHGPDQRPGDLDRMHICDECGEPYDVSDVTFVIDDEALVPNYPPLVYDALQEEFGE